MVQAQERESHNYGFAVIDFAPSQDTDAVLEGLAKYFKYEAFAKRFLKKLKRRKADREAEEAKAAGLDECVEKIEKVLGRAVTV